jgi:hypothetical protein
MGKKNILKTPYRSAANISNHPSFAVGSKVNGVPASKNKALRKVVGNGKK